ncbi:polyprenyl synthetase family protein [Halomonas vilamensis]|uniref:Polyprenyl synthetase family protein n=1 Tax=Vreelandella vilamensis TaxID=531309 RepID=A0ABU1H0V1_9GAMM|nr:polyprenyl synthetase family protein [Halomonas vilamensis]MDR5897849.1 polyprenyl synthetase family protein [Halomonas vilamensis]
MATATCNQNATFNDMGDTGTSVYRSCHAPAIESVNDDANDDSTIPARAACESSQHDDDITRQLAQVDALMRTSLKAPADWPATAASLYHLSTRGNQLRARLALLSGAAYGAPSQHCIAAAAASELIHNASLVHDDLCDGDAQRRGQPSVWRRDNPNVALCSGDLLLTAAFQAAMQSDTPAHCLALLQLLTDRTSRVIAGQSIEVADTARPDRQCATSTIDNNSQFAQARRISLGVYLEATLAKTAPFIALPLEAGALGGRLSNDQHRHIRRFAEAVGLAYQIIDDLDDVDLSAVDHCQPQTFHAYHAWPQHWPFFTHQLPDPAWHTLQRCIRHASAALTRAEHLVSHFPEQLGAALLTILARLRDQLQAHRQAMPPSH